MMSGDFAKGTTPMRDTPSAKITAPPPTPNQCPPCDTDDTQVKAAKIPSKTGCYLLKKKREKSVRSKSKEHLETIYEHPESKQFFAPLQGADDNSRDDIAGPPSSKTASKKSAVSTFRMGKLHNKTYLTESHHAIARSVISKKRQFLPTLHVRGTFYDVGYTIGRTFRSAISDSVHTKLTQNEQPLKFFETPKGKEIYNTMLATSLHYFPHYVRELKGMSEGSGVPFSKLFLCQIGSDIMSTKAEIGDFTMLTGSTTIIMNRGNCEYLAHVEDQPESSLGNSYVVRADIIEEENLHEEFTAFCVGGSMPGWEIAVNRHGFAYTVNSIRIHNHNLYGIPKRLLARALLSVRNVEELKMLLLCKGYGVADAMSINCIFTHEKGERVFYNFEVGPPKFNFKQSQLSMQIVYSGFNYFHLNGFYHLEKWLPYYDINFSSWNKRKEKRIVTEPLTSLEDLIDILGDTGNQKPYKNIFSVTDNLFCSIAVGIFDFKTNILTIYTDNPKQYPPMAEIHF